MKMNVTFSENTTNVGTEFAEDTKQIRTNFGKVHEVGGATPDAVLYTPQTLTEEQKAQARENIGGASEERLGAVEEGLETKLNKPVTWVGKPLYILGVRNNGDICTTTACAVSSSDAIARYNSHGYLTSKNIFGEGTERVTTLTDLYEMTDGCARACYVMAEYYDGKYDVHSDFEESANNIYGNYYIPVLVIEQEGEVELVVGANVQSDEDGNYTSITFDNKYIWRADSSVLEPVEQKEKVYELIETITLEEEVALVERYTDDCERMYIHITLPANSTITKSGYLVFYNNSSWIGRLFVGSVTNTGTHHYVSEIWQEAGSWKSRFGNWNTNTTNLGATGAGTEIEYYPVKSIADYPTIDRFRVYSTMPAGTEIKIWGVRADA